MHVTHKIIHLIHRVCHEFKLEFNRELMKLQIWEPKIHCVPVVDMEEKEGKRLELQIGKQNCKLHYLEVANENLMERGKRKSC